MTEEILIQEKHGHSDYENVYVNSNNKLTVVKVGASKTKTRLFLSARNFFFSVFLPQGYPESVSDDYIEYQLWDSIQAFASSITNTLATHAVLKGVGVGDATATPLAATVTWLLRDGTSMLGRILFAYLQGSKLDSECKKWRLFADIINDIAICIDLASPLFGYLFTLMQCISGLIKSLVGTAGGATRAALTQHQARNNNLADVSAKDGSQETLVNLVALIFSLIIVPIIAVDSILVWMFFLLFTSFHLYSNYRAVKAVSMESINFSRFVILVEHYLQTKTIIPVKEANKHENIWFFKKDHHYDIPLGVSLQKQIKSVDQLNSLMTINSNYILTFDTSKRPSICISLNKNANQTVMVEALFQAIIILYSRKMIKSNDQKIQEIINEFSNNSSEQLKLIKLTRELTLTLCRQMIKEASLIGWNFDCILFTYDEWRYE